LRLKSPRIDRRALLIGGGAGVGLVVAFALWPRTMGSGLRARRGEGLFGHYLKIGSDGRVTVGVPQVETGQGIWTALPQIIADELEAAWENVAVEPAPSAPAYANPLADKEGWLDGLGSWREHRLTVDGTLRITAGSTSVRAFEIPLRQAGATARTLLTQAAADRWGVAAAECDSEGGFILHEGKRLGFGELAVEASRLKPSKVALRAPGSGKLLGQPLPRIDLPAKSDGSARFAGDVRLPGLLYASIRFAPHGGRLTGFSRSGAQGIPGVKRIVVRSGWLAVVAQSWWAAERALVAASPKFTGPARADSLAIQTALDKALDHGDSKKMFERGDYARATRGSRPLTANYAIAPTQHFGLETRTATARFSGDRLEVWAPTQAPELARELAILAAGSAARHTTLYPMFVGDGGGRALEADAVPIAVELARELGHPVQLTYSAKVEQNRAPLRTSMIGRMAALPGAGGTIVAWSARIACSDGMKQALSRLGGWSAKVRPPSLLGAMPPYAIPHVQIDAVATDLPIACGYMRGGDEALTTFLTESFIDEMARAAGAEPLAYRMGMLGGNLRLAHAISTAAGIGGWDGGGAGSSLGIAACSAFGSHIGLLAEVHVGDDQRVKVARLVAAIDCGRIVNPGLVRQQIEGGLLAALALATVDQPAFVAGMPIARARHLPRLADTPTIEVELIPSREAPGGVSGLGATVLAPAVANALAAAGGRRLRNLPFAPMAAA
jgi:isoquinoline 1-oxidoreductase beta subunit